MHTDEPSDDGPPEEPLRIGGYELIREMGHGGQATIFAATQLSTGRKVAVKFMYGGAVASEVERNRLDQEVRILAALDHPNLVSVIDRGETADGSIYFVMPYVQGRTLNEYLDEFRRKNGPPHQVKDLSPLLKIFARLCEAIHAAHLRGIVHRDLKPSNVIVDAYGEPHVLDFGLARGPLPMREAGGSASPTTRTGEFVGSIQWASPEQAEGEARVDIRSDVYSLGVMLYEMLTGDFPYDVFGSFRETLNHIVNDEPVPPSRAIMESAGAEAGPDFENPVDEMLDLILLKALAKKPEERYQSAGEFAKAIHYYLSGYGSLPRRRTVLPPAAPPAPPVESGARAWPIVAVVGLLALAGVAIFLSLRRPSDEPAVAAMVNRESEPVGYFLEGESVVFEFNPELYDNVRLPDGRFDRLTAWGAVRRVSVAGPFNDWGNGGGDWALKREAGGVFRLTVPLREFTGRHVWPFKFVVNGSLWVGAPLDAPNRERVVTDAATYNLLLFNPQVKPDRLTLELQKYRDQINASWPGQGANLTRDEAGGLHFVFNYLSAGVRVGHLEPLAGIPLVSLDLGNTRLAEFGPLRDMRTLKRLVMNDASFGAFATNVLEALSVDDFGWAESTLRETFEPYRKCPAFAQAEQRMADGIRLLASDPSTLPPPQALEFRGHHYLYIPKPVMWSEARDLARSRGGDLVAVGDVDEQLWLAKTFGPVGLGRRIWLGGSDEQREGFWVWSNGERWAYENWTPPEPDNANEAEHCLAMKFDSWWTDNDGGLKFPFLIEWSR